MHRTQSQDQEARKTWLCPRQKRRKDPPAPKNAAVQPQKQA